MKNILHSVLQFKVDFLYRGQDLREKQEVSGIRPLIFGNGRILICEDEKGTIRDVYFPYVGLENHGNSIKTGICDLDSLYCSWLENWKITQRYKSKFEEDFYSHILEITECGGNVEGLREGTKGKRSLKHVKKSFLI